MGVSILISDNHINGFFTGVRRTDADGSFFPLNCFLSGNLNLFSPCSPDWPKAMRINLILDWSYDEIWKILIDLKIPTCSLYDRGYIIYFVLLLRYTSIGSKKNTYPNPSLLKENGEYMHACFLNNPELERSYRK